MNDTEKAIAMIKYLPDDAVLEFMMIAMISPFNDHQGWKLNEKGRAAFRAGLETKIRNMEVVNMTDTNPVVLDASASLIGLYKASYNILENLDQPFKNSEELAKFDEEFFQSLEKMPVIKEIIKHLAKESRTI